MLPYGRQSISESDIAALVEVLRSDIITQGPAIPRFEAAVAEACGADQAIAVSSGTAALHLAMQAMDVRPGDCVWTPPISFVASANAARYCGADVDFVDIDIDTANLSMPCLEDKLTQARRDGDLPKVVVPVHFAGQPCEMDRLDGLAEEFGFRVLEDAAHALGASWKEEPIGSGRWSDAAIFSFHAVKVVTSGEGGVVTTQDPALALRIAKLRTHGITRDPSQMEGPSEGPWYYEQVELGFNYRITDIQAALGTSQMLRLSGFIARRRELAARYEERLTVLNDRVEGLRQVEGANSAWHLYVVKLREAGAAAKRRRVFEQMRERGIGVNVHYIPIHLQPDYARLGFKKGMFPAAESYYDRCLTLPLFPAMRDEDVDFVVDALGQSLEA